MGPGPLVVMVPERIPVREDEPRRRQERDEAEPKLDDLQHHAELPPSRQRELGRCGRLMYGRFGPTRMVFPRHDSHSPRSTRDDALVDASPGSNWNRDDGLCGLGGVNWGRGHW